MTLCENHGAWFIRADGSRIERGDIFEASPEEMAQFAYKIKPVQTPVFAGAPIPLPVATVPPPPTLDQVTGWPLRMAPSLYLEIEPEGPYAKLAREVIEKKAAAEEK